MSADIKDTTHSKFHALLRDQIRNEFNASHQYIATAVYFDNADLPQLAKHFYAQAVEERNHAMMIVQYFLDRDITVELTGVDPSKSVFTDAREPIALALAQEETVTEQIIQLASTAREEGDYVGEQFMQWFLKEQVEEVASMKTLLNIADRAGHNLFDLEEFVAREMSSPTGPDTSAPRSAGGSL
ncbi:ferritin [Rhodococcus sp. H29-C3]|uniref:ferritin n=1 Tax=Rhodococcus sp. H29-C3 TaxID=3046307 RepID=UPI0024B986AC|nr:ferritin [Rhodococcus sp. H29-C3]MDJ0359797.1 ferritin [Rhodococcus sp. H29-C3]